MYAALRPDAPPVAPEELTLLGPSFRSETSLNELAPRVQAYYSACMQEDERVVKAKKTAERIK